MKNFTFILASLLLLASTNTFAITSPTVYTANVPFNTAISGGTSYLENFTELTNSSNAFLSYARPITANADGYAYVVESRSTNPLKERNGALATSVELEPIYIRNTGRGNITYFGGWFYNVTTFGNEYQDSLKITIDNYVYRFKPLVNSTFIGFVFSEPFTEVKIESMSTNALAKCPTVSKVIWGSSLPAGINEQTKKVVLFPNPTTEGIYVNAEGTVSIYATTGQKLLSKQVTANSYLPLNELGKGIYIISIESEEGILQDKLIKK